MRIIKRHHFFLTLLYCVLFAWLIGLYQASPALQAGLNMVIINSQNQINRLLGRKTIPLRQQASQTSSESAVTNARWTQPSATIYIDLTEPTLRSATESAINQWNQTGAFTFHRTKNKDEADIIVTAVNEHKNGAAGLTNTKMNASTGYIIHADVQLNAGYLLSPYYGYSQERITNTAEHELGHAIGLQHTSAISVMQPAGSYYPIQPQDIENVKKLYHKRPSVNQQQGQNNTSQNYQ